MPRLIQTLFLAAVLFYAVLLASSLDGLPVRARLFPSIVLAGLTVLWTLKLAAVMLPRAGRLLEPDVGLLVPVTRSDAGGAQGDGDPGDGTRDPGERFRVSSAAAWAWVSAALLLMLVAGLVPGAGLAVVAYLRGLARERWAASLAAGLITTILMYAAFGWLLHLPAFPGPLLGG